MNMQSLPTPNPQGWVHFGAYKWAAPLVELAKDDLTRADTPITFHTLSTHLRQSYAAYRWNT